MPWLPPQLRFSRPSEPSTLLPVSLSPPVRHTTASRPLHSTTKAPTDLSLAATPLLPRPPMLHWPLIDVQRPRARKANTCAIHGSDIAFDLRRFLLPQLARDMRLHTRLETSPGAEKQTERWRAAVGNMVINHRCPAASVLWSSPWKRKDILEAEPQRAEAVVGGRGERLVRLFSLGQRWRLAYERSERGPSGEAP